MSAVSPGLGVLLLGNSIFEGVGTALLIPPVYILTTMLFDDVTSRARAFGVITGMGGIGAAAGPLIGGLITTAISWRWAFVFQAVIVATIVFLSRSIKDPLPPDPTRPFDTIGAVLSAVGLVLIVMGILAADNNVWLMIALLTVGAVVLAGFFRHVRAMEQSGRGAVAVDRRSSGTASRTLVSSRRTSSGCCSWGRRSSSRPSCRSFVATTRSRRA